MYNHPPSPSTWTRKLNRDGIFSRRSPLTGLGLESVFTWVRCLPSSHTAALSLLCPAIYQRSNWTLQSAGMLMILGLKGPFHLSNSDSRTFSDSLNAYSSPAPSPDKALLQVQHFLEYHLICSIHKSFSFLPAQLSTQTLLVVCPKSAFPMQRNLKSLEGSKSRLMFCCFFCFLPFFLVLNRLCISYKALYRAKCDGLIH